MVTGTVTVTPLKQICGAKYRLIQKDAPVKAVRFICVARITNYVGKCSVRRSL